MKRECIQVNTNRDEQNASSIRPLEINFVPMKNTVLLTISLLILALFLGCSKENTAVPDYKAEKSDTVSNQDYYIYSLILRGNFPKASYVTIYQSTETAGGFLYSIKYSNLKKSFPDIDENLVEYFNTINQTSRELENKFSVPKMKTYLMSKEESANLFRPEDINGGWNDFYKTYPNSAGIAQFSRVGYNNDINQALVWVSSSSASLDGATFLIYLKRDKQTWNIVKRILLWVS